jgi:hypothetical protein
VLAVGESTTMGAIERATGFFDMPKSLPLR